MRWFLIPTVAAAALALANPTPAKAQVIVGGTPTYYSPYSVPLAPYPAALYPGSSGVIPFVNGSPVEFALNQALRSMAWRGYGPYAGYAPFVNPRYYGGAYPAYSEPWNAYRPYVAPANKWVDPWPGNQGWHKGWSKGGGMGGGKGAGKGAGKGGGKGKGR
jgi:hypothetical protein